MLDIWSLDFLLKLGTIIFIDLILAGDNAIVIGMAARNVPKEQQKRVIILGTAGAILIRAVATILVVYLLNIPWLLFVGGLLLLWIAYKLLTDHKEHNIQAGNSVFSAIRTIVIADAAMGIDNVIAVAGAAEGEHQYLLVILGLLISVPIIIWGSTLFIRVINRYPWVIYAGAGVLAYTAAKMVTEEGKIEHVFDGLPVVKWAIVIVIIIAILLAGYLRNRVVAQRESTLQKSG